MFWIFNLSLMLMHAIAQGGCTDTVRKSALKVDSGRKIPCRTGDSNLHQYCFCLFSWTFYQVSYYRPYTVREICPGLSGTGRNTQSSPPPPPAPPSPTPPPSPQPPPPPPQRSPPRRTSGFVLPDLLHKRKFALPRLRVIERTKIHQHDEVEVRELEFFFY